MANHPNRNPLSSYANGYLPVSAHQHFGPNARSITTYLERRGEVVVDARDAEDDGDPAHAWARTASGWLVSETSWVVPVTPSSAINHTALARLRPLYLGTYP